jgi:salicylate hydroxylase
VYASVRQERTARVQQIARVNGARYDASSSNLADRDRQLAAQPRERAWIWEYDAEAEAAAALAAP